MDESFRVGVDVAADADGEPQPRRLRFGERAIEVAEVLDRWPGTGYGYVKLLAADGGLYILRHDEADDGWRLVQFIRAGVSPPPAASPRPPAGAATVAG